MNICSTITDLRFIQLQHSDSIFLQQYQQLFKEAVQFLCLALTTISKWQKKDLCLVVSNRELSNKSPKY